MRTIKSLIGYDHSKPLHFKNGLCKVFFKGALRISICPISMVLVACSANPSNALATIEPTTGEVVFDCFSVNHSWGYQLSGFYIDRHGNVYRYHHNGSKWQPKSVADGKQTYYKSADLLSKFVNIRLNSHIDASVLAKKIALIDSAASGSVSPHTERVADAGQNVCLAYRYNLSNDLYQPIELGSYGITQTRVVNSSNTAKALLQWLMTDVLAQ